MALNLVAYDSSDNESSEQEDASEKTKPVIVPRTPAAVKNIADANDDEDVTNLPKPSEKERELAEIAKKEKANLAKVDGLQKIALKKNGKVIIGIPSLADLEDEVEEEDKKAKKLLIPLQKGQSKLFAKLPAPKNSFYAPPTEHEVLKPVSVSIRPAAPDKKNVPLIPQSVMRREAKKGSDDEDESSGNFFTLDEPALPALSMPINISSSTIPNPRIVAQNEEVIAYPAVPTNQLYNMAGMVDSEVPQPFAAQMELDDTALEALQGTSGVKRKLPEDVQIIDIKQEKLTYDPNMSYVKAISEEQNPSGGEEFTCNKLQKKKHQITWLAAQAKAREVELKNQWAANRNTRKQTQAKYGF